MITGKKEAHIWELFADLNSGGEGEGEWAADRATEARDEEPRRGRALQRGAGAGRESDHGRDSCVFCLWNKRMIFYFKFMTSLKLLCTAQHWLTDPAISDLAISKDEFQLRKIIKSFYEIADRELRRRATLIFIPRRHFAHWIPPENRKMYFKAKVSAKLGFDFGVQQILSLLG